MKFQVLHETLYWISLLRRLKNRETPWISRKVTKTTSTQCSCLKKSSNQIPLRPTIHQSNFYLPKVWLENEIDFSKTWWRHEIDWKIHASPLICSKKKIPISNMFNLILQKAMKTFSARKIFKKKIHNAHPTELNLLNLKKSSFYYRYTKLQNTLSVPMYL